MSTSPDALDLLLKSAPTSGAPPPVASKSPKERVFQKADEIGVPRDLVERLVGRESSWSHTDAFGRVKRSPKNAMGLFQVVPDRGTTRTVGGRQYDLADEGQNTEAGLRYLKEGLDKSGGDHRLASLYYFGGPGALDKAQKSGRIPNISDGGSTANAYVSAVGGKGGKTAPVASRQPDALDQLLKSPPQDAGRAASPAPSVSPTGLQTTPDPNSVGTAKNPNKIEGPAAKSQQNLQDQNVMETAKAPVIPKEALIAPEPDSLTLRQPVMPPPTYNDQDVRFTGNVGRIMGSGPQATEAYKQFLQRNVPHVKGKAVAADSLIDNEPLATVFANLQDYFAQNPKAKPKEQARAIAQMGKVWLANPNTDGMQMPTILHQAMLSAHWTPEEVQSLPSALRSQIQQRQAQARTTRRVAAPGRRFKIAPDNPMGDVTAGAGGGTEGVLPQVGGAPSLAGIMPHAEARIERESERLARNAPSGAGGLRMIDDPQVQFMQTVEQERRRTTFPGDAGLFDRLKSRGIADEDARAVVNLSAGPPTPSIMQSAEERAQTQAARDEWERHQIAVKAMADSNKLTDQLRDRATQKPVLRRVLDMLSPATAVDAASQEPAVRLFTAGAVEGAGSLSNTGADLLHFVDTLGNNIQGNTYVAKLTDKMRDLGAYLQGAADIRAVTPTEAFSKSAGSMAGQAEKFAIMRGATKLPFWAIMGSEAALRTQTQPVAVQAKETAWGIVQGVAIEFGPEIATKVLGKMPGLVGSLARQFPKLIGTGTTAGGFGGLAAEETYRKTGSKAEAAGAGIGAAAATAGLSLIGGGAKDIAKEAARAESLPEWARDTFASFGGLKRGLVIDHDGRALSLYADPKTKGVGGEEISAEKADKYAQRGPDEMPVRRVSPEEFDQWKDLVKSKAPKSGEDITKTITGEVVAPEIKSETKPSDETVRPPESVVSSEIKPQKTEMRNEAPVESGVETVSPASKLLPDDPFLTSAAEANKSGRELVPRLMEENPGMSRDEAVSELAVRRETLGRKIKSALQSGIYRTQSGSLVRVEKSADGTVWLDQLDAETGRVRGQESDVKVMAGAERIADLPSGGEAYKPETRTVSSVTGEDFRRAIKTYDGDLEKAGQGLLTRIDRSLTKGNNVTLFDSDGKPHKIVTIERGMMKDDKGQRWGTLDLATDNTGKARVEIASPPLEQPAVSPVLESAGAKGVSGFTTAKGSTYTVDGDTTTRFKKATGKQYGASGQTVYVDRQTAMDVQSAMQSTSFEMGKPDGAILRNEKDGQLYIVDRAKDGSIVGTPMLLKYEPSPKVGLSPVEIGGKVGIHVGHPITEVRAPESTRVPAGGAKPAPDALDNLFAGLPKEALSKVLAHVAGPSGSGKTELVNKLGESVKNIDLVDLDIFDEQAVKALGLEGKSKNDFTDAELDRVHEKRQSLIDDYIEKSAKPIVFFGHHIEGENVTDLPTEDRYLLNVNPTKAALNASRRPGKTAAQIKEDIAIGKQDVSDLKKLDYEPLSSRAIYSKIKQLSEDVTHGRQNEEVQSISPASDASDKEASGPTSDAVAKRSGIRQAGGESAATGQSSGGADKSSGKEEKASRPKDVNQASSAFQDWWEKQGPRGRDAIRAYLETGSTGQAVGAWKDAASGVKLNDKAIKAAVNNLVEETNRRLSSEAGTLAFGEIYGVVSNLIQRARDQLTIDPVPGLKRLGVSAEARQHAAARVAVPYVVRDILAKVFPEQYADPEAMALTMDVINKDNILGGYDTFLKNAREASAGQDTAMAQFWQDRADAVGDAQDIERLEEDVAAAKENPQIMANIDRWVEHVNPEIDRMYNEMKRVDPDTPREGRGREFGARVNLLPEARAAEMKNFGDLSQPMPEAVSSNYRNPNVKKDKFMKLARFTGQYSTDAEAVLTNVIGPRLNEVTKLRLYDALTASGAAVELDYGETPPAKIQDQKAVRLPIKVPETGEGGLTRMVEKALYVRADIAREVRDVLNTDMPLPQNKMARWLTTIQLAQLTDMTAHLKNIHTVLAAAPGTRSAFTDAMRRLPILGSVDSIARIIGVTRGIIADTPASRAEQASMARLGLLRPEYPLTGLQKITRGQQVIHRVDTASRIVMNRFFDNLVEAGRVKDTEENRASFVQQIGEYNRRLMGPIMRAARDAGFAPFVVAGRTFNRQGRRLLTGNPGVEASTLGESARMRLVNIIAGLVAASVLPAILNLLTTGNLGGRPGTPIGAWDLGYDEDERGRHRVIDIMQIVGIRRGLRGTGANAAIEGLREGQTWDEIIGHAGQDVTSTLSHPWMGPALGFVYQTVTGKRLDLRGGPEAPEALNVGGGGKQYLENARTALENQNPLLAGVLSPLTDPYETEDSYAERIGKGLTKGPASSIGLYDLQSPAQKILSEDRRRRGAFSKTADQMQARELKSKLHEDERAGKNISSALDQAVTEGKLSLRQAHDFKANAGMTPLAMQIKYASLEASVRAFEIMDDKQKSETRTTMALKLEGAKPEFFTDDMRSRLKADGFTIPDKIGPKRKESESRRETQKARKEKKAEKRWLPPESRSTPNPNRRYQVTPR